MTSIASPRGTMALTADDEYSAWLESGPESGDDDTAGKPASSNATAQPSPLPAAPACKAAAEASTVRTDGAGESTGDDSGDSTVAAAEVGAPSPGKVASPGAGAGAGEGTALEAPRPPETTPPPEQSRLELQGYMMGHSLRVRLRQHPEITSLSVTEASQLTTVPLRALLGLPLLEEASFLRCGALWTHDLPPLQELNTDGGDVVVGVPTHKSLQSLDLSGCQHLQDATVAAVAACFPTLYRLTLNECTGLRRFPVEAAALPQIHTLELRAARHVSVQLQSAPPQPRQPDTGEYVPRPKPPPAMHMRECPSLTCLDMTDVPGLGDAALTAIAIACPALITLDLTRCQGLREFPLCVAHHCHRLERLVLDAANLEVDVPLEQRNMDPLESLSHLNVNGSPRIECVLYAQDASIVALRLAPHRTVASPATTGCAFWCTCSPT